MGILSNIAENNKFTPEHVKWFDTKLFFEGAGRRRNYEQFGVLLFLSAVIATYGIMGDSTATVIGAMIIAPLMTPIMATAAALVTGRFDRAFRSVLLVTAGVAGVIGVAWLLTLTNFTSIISIETNLQIAGRISPRLIDLYAALASGAAGAFAMSRKDVSDSLPGVAISISLVPPLCVVGICLAEDELTAAIGALLLFITNFLSILLAGGGVLALLGLAGAATKHLQKDVRRKAFIYIAIGVVIIAIPLAVTSIRVAQDSYTETVTKSLAQEWVNGTDFQVSRINANGDQVNIVIYGQGQPPTLVELGDSIQESLDRFITIKLNIVPSEEQVYGTLSE